MRKDAWFNTIDFATLLDREPPVRVFFTCLRFDFVDVLLLND
jgi:hypothetical protein